MGRRARDRAIRLSAPRRHGHDSEAWTSVIAERLASLTAEERHVISLRLGLDRSGFPRTLEEVGALTALSRSDHPDGVFSLLEDAAASDGRGGESKDAS